MDKRSVKKSKSMQNGTVYINSIEGKFVFCKAVYENNEIVDYEVYDMPNNTTTYERTLINTETGEVKNITKNKKIMQCALSKNSDMDNLREMGLNIVTVNGKYFTKDIVNVTFNTKVIQVKKGDKMETYAKDIDIRNKLYETGFVLDGEHYSEFKRSSGKARTGSTLFIKDKFLPALDKARGGLKYDDKTPIDVAGLRAYEGLALSGLEGEVKIEPHEILIINDWKNKFSGSKCVLVGEDEQHNITVSEEITDIENDLFDGQCLLDESKFKSAIRYSDGSKAYKNKSMLLLRESMQLKANALNTKIQRYFMDMKVKKVVDMFGIEHDAKDIKMIITPNGLKFLKQKDHDCFGGNVKSCYEYWLNNMSCVFGIVKTEHESKYGEKQKLSYQMINSLPLSREQVKQLVNEEVSEIDKMKTDDMYFLDYINKYSVNPFNKTMLELYKKNNNILKTRLFDSFRKSKISGYKSEVECGKVKVSKADYFTMFALPLEMLQSAHKDRSKIKISMSGEQVFTTAFENGEKLGCFRNPNVCQGNAYVCTNVHIPRVLKYFNLTKNIVIVNNFDVNIMNRLSGCDFDSDTCLLTNNETVYNACNLAYNEFSTPVCTISGEKKLRPLTAQNKAEVDHIIANNYIGKIVNLSQVLLTKYWEIYRNDKNDSRLKEIYYDLCVLDALSGVEIDKAKKLVSIDTKNELVKIQKKNTFVDIHNEDGAITEVSLLDFEKTVGMTLHDAKKKGIVEDKDIKKLSKPVFMLRAQKQNIGNATYKNCPMDDVKQVINESLREISAERASKGLSSKKNFIEIKDVLDYTGADARVNNSQVDTILAISQAVAKEVKNNARLASMSKDHLCIINDNDAVDEFANYLSSLSDNIKEKVLKSKMRKVSKTTMIKLIEKAFEGEAKGYSMYLMTVLAQIDEKLFLNCFKEQ